MLTLDSAFLKDEYPGDMITVSKDPGMVLFDLVFRIISFMFYR
jgi:hypothetical protein